MNVFCFNISIRGYPDLSAEYLEGVQLRLYDEGISVRKSVVNIMKEILLTQPSHDRLHYNTYIHTYIHTYMHALTSTYIHTIHKENYPYVLERVNE